MLVLSRKVGERLLVGDDVVLIVAAVKGNTVRLAIEAPASVRIVRSELKTLPPKEIANAESCQLQT